VALLARVSGLNASIAQNIVAHRDTNGRFASRELLRSVPRLGEKTFEQAAGFLRIAEGDNPLDASAVHPEAYPVVERILTEIGREAKAVIGDSATLKALDATKFADAKFGVPTITDILRELEKPGRDPRPEFKTATFKEGVEALKDLQTGMILEGVITNVTNFGAFVDIGVHQDGLVHISALSDKFVKDPREVVKAGDLVRVKVLEVDEKRKRIALSMRLNDASSAAPKRERTEPRERHEPRARSEPRKDQSARPVVQPFVRPAPKPATPADSAMALAFARAKRG
jgi:protein Tex